MFEDWATPVYPITGKKPRNIWVYVPDEAEEDPEARFPVLYMLDGHNVFLDELSTFGKSWGMLDYLQEDATPVIVVGIDCNHRPNNGRLSEYSPFTFQDEKYGRIFGKGRLFMDWLCGELKPMIDERYPTIPDREATWIGGSSMGGLMSLYAVTAYNGVFGKAASLSPSLWTSPKRLNSLFRTAELAPDTVVYMSYGAREMANHEGMAHIYTVAQQILMERGVLLTSRVVPNGDHCEECWQEQLPFFMNTLLYERA